MSVMPELLTPKQTAEWLGISVESLAQKRYMGNGIPYVKINSRVRYLKDDVIAYVQKNRVTNDA